MTNANSPISLSLINQVISRSLLVTFLTSISLLCGLAPNLSFRSPHLILSSSAFAQAISDDDLRRFAQAAYAIERKRQAVVEGIVRRNLPVPDTTCAAGGNIPPELKDFCEFSRQTIEANQLTVGRFQQIRSAVQSDPTLKQKVDAELRRLQ
ncbi:DUF4168 domain-containing protein [Phormidium sp. LEGE 05292]|uniref:DUF4168 domain-containing protein n=1 Tax=[Phormidium] sp. LEGE 05292 TaxID=767427 RepID=UPI0018808CE4|nr:DUF4168 domain-containing protein [Phormidium sp. LEGE 05292]MBE9229546.1 DUF4168 domain-containing protein [Phormidium sp. LEGE 05292]